jgi:hypothetical protein
MESPRLWRNDIFDFLFVFTPVYNMSVFPKYQIWSIVNLLLIYGENLISRVWKKTQNFNDLMFRENFEIRKKDTVHVSALNFIDCGLSGSTLHNTHFMWKTVEFRKNILNTKCVFCFPLQLFLNISHSENWTITMYTTHKDV